MNVFVLCTGRSGSLAFSRACGHMTNFTAGHETRGHLLGEDRFAFAPDHIEVDNRLAWMLGRLDEAYGDEAWYVHLTRDPEKVALSWSRKFGSPAGMAPAYRDAILMNAARNPPVSRLESSRDYVETVTANIRAFLKDKSRVMDFAVETAAQDFAAFWSWIGAEGSLEDALAEWDVRHDTRIVELRPKNRIRAWLRRVARSAFPPP